MNFATSSGLLLLGLFLLPVLVSGCLPYGRDGVPWYEARRDSSGLAPDPATTAEAVIQIYAARAVSWRGVFSMHTWIAAKPTGAPRPLHVASKYALIAASENQTVRLPRWRKGAPETVSPPAADWATSSRGANPDNTAASATGSC